MLSVVCVVVLLAAYSEAMTRNPAQLFVQSRQKCDWDTRPTYHCSAVLLSAYKALTVAGPFSKFSPLTPSNFRVVAAENEDIATRNRPSVFSYVDKIKLHKQFKNGNKYANDIAILTLATPIYANGDTIKYAKLPANNDDQFIGMPGVITGWAQSGYSSSPSKRWTYVSNYAQDTTNCEDLPIGVVNENNICLKYYSYDSRGTGCVADYGAPFSVETPAGDNIVAGLTAAYETHSHLVGWYDVYTVCAGGLYVRVGAYLQWIADN